MIIPANVNIIHVGTHASIPTGYVRQTLLDGRFLKGSAAGVNPNVTGGADTHNHTSSGHNHTFVAHTHTGTFGTQVGTTYHDTAGSGIDAADGAHSHTFTTGNPTGTVSTESITWSNASNNPPFYEVIFIKSLGTVGVPDDAVVFFDNATLPTGYQFCNGVNGSPDLRGKFLRGAATGQNAGATGGAANHTHTSSHNHAMSHYHTGNSSAGDTGGVYYTGSGTTPIPAHRDHFHSFTTNTVNETSNTYNATSDSQSNEPLYKKLLAIQNQNGRPDKSIGIIGMWLESLASIPPGWFICDGTNGTLDLRQYFVKIATDDTEIGNTGGNNTHGHGAVAHTQQATAVHGHSGNSDTAQNTGRYEQNGGKFASSVHYHPINTISTQTTSLASANIPATSTNDNQPLFRTVVFIQYKQEFGQGNPFLMM